MSRTFKDKPSKIRFPEVYPYWIEVEKTKKKREEDTEWHWMSTPSWWTRLTMNRPERRANSLLERSVLFNDIEEFDFPNLGHKPHNYYY